MHRVTNESGLTDSADGSIAKDAGPLRSTMKKSATSALTNSAFSWKFACKVLLEPATVFSHPLVGKETFQIHDAGRYPLHDTRPASLVVTR
jgi:hypothetical protein